VQFESGIRRVLRSFSSRIIESLDGIVVRGDHSRHQSMRALVGGELSGESGLGQEAA